MPLYELSRERMHPIDTTTFAAAQFREREDLQRLFREQLDALVPDAMVLTEEFGDWEDSSRRIDLLALDREANLVVVELKRTDDGGHMELQAIRYAAMVSAMTWDQAVDAHQRYLDKQGIQEDARDRILAFLGWSAPNGEQFAQKVRIVLASANFSKEITTAVLWLAAYDIDIRCVRLVPYRLGEKTLLDIQQVIPLPEAEEYQTRIREKAAEERVARDQSSNARKELNRRFWTRLLAHANGRTPLHRNLSPTDDNWLTASALGCGFSYVTARDKSRIELAIDRSSLVENKALYDHLNSVKDQIEDAFGQALDWRRQDEISTSRIFVEVPEGSVKDEKTWEAMHAAMVATMIRFHSAFSSYLEKYRRGESLS